MTYREIFMRLPVIRQSRKIGRNEPCPCCSGLKFKKCCIDKVKLPNQKRQTHKRNSKVLIVEDI